MKVCRFHRGSWGIQRTPTRARTLYIFVRTEKEWNSHGGLWREFNKYIWSLQISQADCSFWYYKFHTAFIWYVFRKEFNLTQSFPSFPCFLYSWQSPIDSIIFWKWWWIMPKCSREIIIISYFYKLPMFKPSKF